MGDLEATCRIICQNVPCPFRGQSSLAWLARLVIPCDAAMSWQRYHFWLTGFCELPTCPRGCFVHGESQTEKHCFGRLRTANWVRCSSLSSTKVAFHSLLGSVHATPPAGACTDIAGRNGAQPAEMLLCSLSLCLGGLAC